MNDESIERKVELLSAKIDVLSAQVAQFEEKKEAHQLVLNFLLEMVIPESDAIRKLIIENLKQIRGMLPKDHLGRTEFDALINLLSVESQTRKFPHLRLVRTDETKSHDDDQP